MSDETFLPLKALRPDEQNQSFCVFHSEIATFTDVDPKLFKHFWDICLWWEAGFLFLFMLLLSFCFGSVIIYILYNVKSFFSRTFSSKLIYLTQFVKLCDYRHHRAGIINELLAQCMIFRTCTDFIYKIIRRTVNSGGILCYIYLFNYYYLIILSGNWGHV